MNRTTSSTHSRRAFLKGVAAAMASPYAMASSTRADGPAVGEKGSNVRSDVGIARSAAGGPLVAGREVRRLRSLDACVGARLGESLLVLLAQSAQEPARWNPPARARRRTTLPRSTWAFGNSTFAITARISSTRISPPCSGPRRSTPTDGPRFSPARRPKYVVADRQAPRWLLPLAQQRSQPDLGPPVECNGHWAPSRIWWAS